MNVSADPRLGVWLTEQTLDCGTVHHLSLTIDLTGPVDADALVAACADALAATDAFRTTIRASADGPVLGTCPAPVVPPVQDIDESDLEKWVTALADQPFDLETGPTARAVVARLAPDRAVVAFCGHHLVFDGASKDILIGDIAARYRRLTGAASRPGDQPAEDIGPRKHAAGTEPAPDRESFTRWQAADPVLPGTPHASLVPMPGAAHRVVLPPRLRSQIAGAAVTWSRSAFEIHFAVLAALLTRYGTVAPQISIDVSTRERDAPAVVGMQVNELPVTVDPDLSAPLSVLADQVGTRLRAMYRYRTTPFTELAGPLTPRSALTAVSLSYRATRFEPDFGPLTATVDWARFGGTARNTLHVQIVDGPDEVVLVFQHPANSTVAQHVVDIAEHYVNLLAEGTAGDVPLADLALLSNRDRRVVDASAFGPTPDQRREQTAPGLFRRQAFERPDEIALVTDDAELSYAALLALAERGARRLAEAGVSTGDRVATLLGRGPLLIPALLAVHLAGAAYVPVDPAYPADRIAYVLADCGATLVLTNDGSATGAAEVLAVSELFAAGTSDLDTRLPEPTAADPAYLIYTSGSTGRPKGVQVSHGALVTLLGGLASVLDSRADDAWLALTSLSFDIAALEIFLPLSTGGRCVLAPDGAGKDAAGLLRLLRDRAVTHAQATPSGWRVLTEAGLDAPGLTAIVGGEALPADFGRDLAGRVKHLFNAYGPTEATVWATTAPVAADSRSVVIGQPLAGYSAHVLDRHERSLPVGVPGELYLGGAGIADHYHARPALTADRFVPDPFGAGSGGRLYRTGDRVVLGLDGNLEFLGRSDHQVKIRGHRVEPGEIEAVLVEHAAVAQAVVTTADDGAGPRLVAFVRPVAAGFGDAAALREHAAHTLPSVMVPSAFVFLDAWPLTPNGKIDRSALLASQPLREIRDASGGGPRSTAAEAVLAPLLAIWAELLGFDDIGPDEDFFDLGGHSLTAIQLGIRIKERFGVDVPIDVFFDLPTPALVAEHIAGKTS